MDMPLKKERKDKLAKKEQADRFSKQKIRRYFADSHKKLKSMVTGTSIYEIPRVIMIGKTGSGKTTALLWSDPDLDSPEIIQSLHEKKESCEWNFFSNGIVFDIDGELIQKKGGEWRYVLTQIKRYRSRRPIDCVVLTIPCTDFIIQDNEQPSEQQEVRIKEQARNIEKKLKDLGDILGMKYPVYILVTKCDKIAGFKSFCRETFKIKKGLQNDIFGWSSDYRLDTPYKINNQETGKKGWAEEAFDSINRALLQTQFEIFAEATDLKEENGDDLFVFPYHFKSVSHPLQIFMDTLFKEDVYKEHCFFRGIYFTGDSGIKKDNINYGDEDNKFKRPFFMRHLFEKKVFPESKLAEPLKTKIKAQTYHERIVQIIGVLLLTLLALGLWSESERLQENKKELQKIYTKINKDIDALEINQTLPSFKISANNVTRGYEIAKMNLTSFFIPSSFFSSSREIIEESTRVAYKRIIFDSMYAQFERKIKEILLKAETTGNVSSNRKTAFANIPEIEKITEYETFYGFVKEFREFEKYVEKYNQLNGSQTLMQDLREIVKYLFETNFDTQLHDREELKRFRYKKLTNKIYEVRASRIFKHLSERLYRRLFDDSRYSYTYLLVSHLEELSNQLERFRSNRRRSRSKSLSDAQIKDILNAFNQVEDSTGNNKYNWISEERLFNTKPFHNMKAYIEKSDTLKIQALPFYDEGERFFENFRKRLLEKKNAFTGEPLLEHEGSKVILALSEKTLLLKKMLSDLQPVVMSCEHTDIKTCPFGHRTLWSINALEETIASIGSYETYLDQGQTASSIDENVRRLQKFVVQQARKNMDRCLLHKIKDAFECHKIPSQITAGQRETFIADEIASFKEASKVINHLKKSCKDFEFNDCHSMLSKLLLNHADTMLAKVSGLLKSDSAYWLKSSDNLLWWDGKDKSLALTAFGVVDEDQLRHYLSQQRNRIRRIAYEYAEPLFAVYTRQGRLSSFERDDFRNLKRIIESFENYDRETADNSIRILENFILFEMNQINVDNYIKKIRSKNLDNQSSDIFLQRRNDLRRMIYERCQEISLNRLTREYKDVAALFNKKLAGKFPFSEATGNSEADLNDIRTFFNIFNSRADRIRYVIEKNRQFANSSSGKEVISFLNRAEKIRELFVQVEGEQNPVINFEVEFRANQRSEELGHYIAEWNFETGEKMYESSGGNVRQTGKWRFGEPVVFSLRWAANATIYPAYDINPVESGQHKKITYDTGNRKVKYEFSGKWSLLRFIKAYSMTAGIDPEPYTLKFETDTMRKGTESRKTITRVFIRISPFLPDQTKKALAIRDFPKQAPGWPLPDIDYSDLNLHSDSADPKL